MRHRARTALVAGASALLLATGTGTAAAQGSLGLVFPADIPALSSLASLLGLAPAGPAGSGPAPAGPAPAGAPSPAPTATGGETTPAALGIPLPPEVTRMAFEGAVVAGLNEARAGMAPDRLVTDPRLGEDAREAAARRAADPEVDPVAEAADNDTLTRIVLDLDPGTSPQGAIAALLADQWSRDRVFDRENNRLGVGASTAEDGRIHLVVDLARAGHGHSPAASSTP